MRGEMQFEIIDAKDTAGAPARHTTTTAKLAAVVLRSVGNEAYASVSPSGVSRIFLAA
jgi:hypothetical protein